MVKLVKKVLPANRYKVSSNKGRLLKEFREDYIKKVADNTNNMIAAGLKIPAPFTHHPDAKPRTDDEIVQFEKEIQVNKPAHPYFNAGYWTRFWVDKDEKGVPTVFGEVDAPGDISDPNSPAYKLKNTNDEVSVSITDNFEDGQGRTWTDSFLHVAIVNHAVVDKQEPFKEMPDNVTVVNMSMAVDDNTSLISELVTVLKKVKIVLPGTTNESTFLRDLYIALMQVSEQENTSDLVPAPIYMSIEDDMPLTEAQAKALVATKAVNPDTGKPFTMEDFGFKVAPPTPPVNLDLTAQLVEANKKIESMTSMLSAIMSQVSSKTTSAVQQRINALIDAGKITKEFADANLQPKLEYQLSITPDKKIADHPLEVMLSALEAMPTPAKGQADSFGTAHANPYEHKDADSTDVENMLNEWEKSGIDFASY